jgi:hypothetical protein
LRGRDTQVIQRPKPARLGARDGQAPGGKGRLEIPQEALRAVLRVGEEAVEGAGRRGELGLFGHGGIGRGGVR